MLDEMLRRCDRNADGYLSFNEFARNFLAQVPLQHQRTASKE